MILRLESKENLTPLVELFKDNLKIVDQNHFGHANSFLGETIYDTYIIDFALKRKPKSIIGGFEQYFEVLFDPIIKSQLGKLWLWSNKVFNIELATMVDFKFDKELCDKLSELQCDVAIKQPKL